MEPEQEAPVSVAVIDDDPMICQAMAMIVTSQSEGRIAVAFTATDGDEAVKLAGEHQPDVMLMDIAMPRVDGIEATRRIASLPRHPHVLMLTSVNPKDTIERAIEAGAEGFISKADNARDIVSRILEAAQGTPQFNAASQKQLAGALRRHQNFTRVEEARRQLDRLPQRVRETVLLAAEGASNSEIAGTMYISERTVKAHLSEAMATLGMNRVQLARLVERAEL